MVAYLSEFFVLWTALMLGAIVPGADVVMVVRNTIIGGKKLGIVTALGTSLEIGLHCSYTALGMGVLLAESPIVLKLIQYFGALFLLFLGARLWQQSFKIKPQSTVVKKFSTVPTLFKGFQTGFILDVLNPFAALYLISLLTTEIHATTPLSVRFIYILGLTLSDFLLMVMLAIFLSQNVWREVFFKHIHWVNRLSGTVLLLIGSKFLVS